MILLVDRAYLATLLHTPECGRVELLRDTLIVANDDGEIVGVHTAQDPGVEALVRRFAAAGTLVRFGADQYLLPGLVDLHIHAPQWPQLGLALDLPLEEWLQIHTFPLEARYADGAYAATVYASLVDGLLANGTTTAMYFGTIHLEATQILAQICLEKSQRALIGRVAMDDPAQCPPYYRDPSAEFAAAQTRAFIEYVQAMPGNGRGLVRPVITPRFIPSCTDELLAKLGALAADSGCHVQTHCSESDWEHRFVFERFGISDTAALAKFGLLSRRTILAHGNFLSDDDLASIAAHGAGIAHCPLSNVYFSDAVFPLRRVLDRGVHVGLGSDIAGGSSPSILDNARHAVLSSRLLESGVDPALVRSARRRPESRIDAPTAFWLATVGGGIALDLNIGLFRLGYQFDALCIDTAASDSNLRVASTDTPEQILQKILYEAARSNIRDVWVANRHVRGSDTGQRAA
jgi:guanine deaminase